MFTSTENKWICKGVSWKQALFPVDMNTETSNHTGVLNILQNILFIFRGRNCPETKHSTKKTTNSPIMEIQNDAGKLVKHTRTEICWKQEAGRICQS